MLVPEAALAFRGCPLALLVTSQNAGVQCSHPWPGLQEGRGGRHSVTAQLHAPAKLPPSDTKNRGHRRAGRLCSRLEEEIMTPQAIQGRKKERFKPST